MAITIVGTPQAGGAIDGGNVTLTFDVTPQENDVVLFWGGHQSRAGDSFGPVTAGYTALVNQDGQGQTPGNDFYVGYKVMGASPDTTVVGRGNGNAADACAYGCYVLRGVDTAVITDATTTVADSGGVSSSVDCPSITTATAAAWVFALFSKTGLGTQETVLSGYTDFILGEGNDATFDARCAGCRKEITTPGTEDPPAYNTGGTIWRAATVAIKPDSGATPAVATPSGLLLMGAGRA